MFAALKTTVLLALAVVAACSADVTVGDNLLRHRKLADRCVEDGCTECDDDDDVCGSFCDTGHITTCRGGVNKCIPEYEWVADCLQGDTCGNCPDPTTPPATPPGECTHGCVDVDSCFSATATLFVRGKGLVAMQDAEVGDMVRTTSDDTFEPLYAFGHRDKEQEATFLKITTDSKSLEVTGAHLIYLSGKTRPVRADSIKVGDQLQAANGSRTVVKDIGYVVKAGLYAPLVPSGRLWVDGVLVSSYIALQEEDNEFFSTLNGLLKIPHDGFAHLYLSPFRVVCMGMTDKPCHVMNTKGIPLYIAWGMDTIHMVHHSTKAYAQPLFVLITSVLLSGFVIVEGLFGARMGPLIIFSIAIAYAFARKGKSLKCFTISE
jgi:Hint module